MFGHELAIEIVPLIVLFIGDELPLDGVIKGRTSRFSLGCYSVYIMNPLMRIKRGCLLHIYPL